MNDFNSGEERFNRHLNKNHVAAYTHHAKIETLFHSYNKRFSRDVLDVWSTALTSYDSKTLNEAIMFMVNTSKFMPALSELKIKGQEVGPIKSVDIIAKNKIEELILVERQRYHALRDAYKAACEQKGVNPIDSLDALVKKWLMAKFGDYKNYEKWSFPLNLFEQCALFDLEKAKRLNRDFETVAKG